MKSRSVTSSLQPVTGQISQEAAPEPDADPTLDRDALQHRFRLYRLCDCGDCGGSGKNPAQLQKRCDECRGEGRVRERVATCADPQSVGVALVTLAREGEFEDCPLGLLDTMGEKGKKWLILPWLPSPRNVGDAARVLARSKQ